MVEAPFDFRINKKTNKEDPNNYVFSTSFEDEELRQIIVSMFVRKDMCPVLDGDEYIFFCRSIALLPSVVGSGAIYPVVEKKVNAYLADFPRPGISVEEVKNNREGSLPPRIEVEVSDFIKQVKMICKTMSAE